MLATRIYIYIYGLVDASSYNIHVHGVNFSDGHLLGSCNGLVCIFPRYNALMEM
ncbi:hypothetical protein HanIR_Chr01g0035881 [Helianthus annuus]|nr:hypothetical protein HanIR_Chr01g0035881 [Helianthus annuus]